MNQFNIYSTGLSTKALAHIDDTKAPFISDDLESIAASEKRKDKEIMSKMI